MARKKGCCPGCDGICPGIDLPFHEKGLPGKRQRPRITTQAHCLRRFNWNNFDFEQNA